MLAQERQFLIIKQIMQRGTAYITDLAKEFGVSDETIRRDLLAICKEHPIRRVHGGAVAIKRPARDASYEERSLQNLEAKQKIGSYAAAQIYDNDVIFIDTGTATEALANAIFGIQNLKILTNSIPVAHILLKKLKNGDFTGNVLLIGGEANPETESVSGPIATFLLERFFVDKAFIGATSVSKDGIMLWSETEGMFTASLIKKAGETFVLAESEKFRKQSFYKVCGFFETLSIVTDDVTPIPNEITDALNNANTVISIVNIKTDKG